MYQTKEDNKYWNIDDNEFVRLADSLDQTGPRGLSSTIFRIYESPSFHDETVFASAFHPNHKMFCGKDNCKLYKTDDSGTNTFRQVKTTTYTKDNGWFKKSTTEVEIVKTSGSANDWWEYARDYSYSSNGKNNHWRIANNKGENGLLLNSWKPWDKKKENYEYKLEPARCVCCISDLL